jgi:hypothetical protein
MSIRTAILMLVLVSGWPVAGHAEPSLSASELLQYCSAWRDEPRSSTGLYCPAYVRGFMDGAASKTRLRAGSEVVAESFLDRARRTRLTDRNSVRPSYCVDSALALESLIAQVLTVGEGLSGADDLKAHDLLVRTLQRFHRCGVSGHSSPRR